MKKGNKIVIFDWGGVIEIHDNNKYNISKVIVDIMKYYNCALTDNEIIEICSKGDKLHSTFINNDEETTVTWFNEVKSKLKITCTYEEYKNAYYKYGKKIPYYKDVVEYAHNLKEKCNIGIFSNLVKLDEKRINEQVDLSMFDYAFLSYQMGYIKPNPKAYEYIEKRLKINSKEILFIDDTNVNIDEARKRKWNTCNACGYELDKIKENVEKFLKE